MVLKTDIENLKKNEMEQLKMKNMGYYLRKVPPVHRELLRSVSKTGLTCEDPRIRTSWDRKNDPVRLPPP